jgi:hypothetical protein
MTGNGRRLAALTAFLCLLMTSGFAAAGNGNDKSKCNAGKGNGSELIIVGDPTQPPPRDYQGNLNDCDPGNSGAHNHAGDLNPVS